MAPESAAPFREGYLYRVKKNVPADDWCLGFAQGEELIFASSGNATDPGVALLHFYPVADASHSKEWGVNRDRLAAARQEYFEEVGPWQATLK